MAAPASPSFLLAGCGDLGTEVALRARARGESVLALRRRTSLAPGGIAALSVDLTRDTPDLPPGSYRSLAVVLTADGADPDAYRATYVDGLRRTLDALERLGRTPERAVLVSSTGVYGEATGDLDESSAVAPSRPTHEILLEAERLFHGRLPHATVLRLAGLYGPGRATFIGRARDGAVRERWTNRIHRDDAAAAVVHLLDPDGDAPGLLIGSDLEPARATDVADLIRHTLGLPALDRENTTGGDTATGAGTAVPGRRLSSAALRRTDFRFTYPTYREGYAAILAGRGERHP